MKLEFVKRTCKGSTPILCPNYMCAASYNGCITPPPNGCEPKAPFKCQDNGIETVLNLKLSEIVQLDTLNAVL